MGGNLHVVNYEIALKDKWISLLIRYFLRLTVNRIFRHRFLRLIILLEFIHLWILISKHILRFDQNSSKHILFNKLYVAMINNVWWKNLYMVAWWKDYKLQDIRLEDKNFHRWMKFNREIKCKNVSRNTLNNGSAQAIFFSFFSIHFASVKISRLVIYIFIK